MTFAAAIFLIAAGAILRYAVTAHSSVVNLDTLGLILMIVGFAGLILAFVQELIWTDRVDPARPPPGGPPPPSPPGDPPLPAGLIDGEGAAGSHRLLGLELPRLARGALSRVPAAE